MAVPAGTYQQFGAIGVREDLSDVIYDISPTDTPFMSNAKRTTASNTLHEWQTDALASAVATNAAIEGDDAAADTAVASVRYANRCQISRKVPQVSGTLRAVDTAGRRDEMSYQIAKRGRELKRDIETTLLGTQISTAGGAGTARTCAGLATWLWNNQIKNTSSNPTAATTATVTSGAPGTAIVAGTAGTFIEADLKSAIKECWDDGGDPSMIMVGSFNKQKASAFTGIATQYRDNPQVGPATLIAAADTYVSDFGQHSIVANRFQPAGTAYVLDMEYMGVAYLRSIRTESLSKTGDSDRSMLLAEYTLEVRSPESSAKVYTLTTA